MRLSFDRALGLGAVALLAASPLLFSDYFVSAILTETLWLGIAAASLIFLSAYGGMVSLAQVAVYGVAAFAMGNMVANGGSKGLNLGWNPYLALLLSILIAVGVGFVFGAVSSRSAGIYFLMITLVFSVIVNLFFGQVTQLSGFGGVQINRFPSFLGSPIDHPFRLFYLALGVSIAAYALIRFIIRTPFGIALQGIRDEPVRMASLGYNVALHRTLAFTFAAFIASFAGILSAWWNGIMAPSSIDLNQTINVLVVAVIGGLLSIEGAWIGAFAFAIIDNYLQNIHFINDRFRTVVGLIFLVIVLVSPDGIVGLWNRLRRTTLGRRSGGRGRPPESAAEAGA
jgi:branched-chain amino acid transport system permease protein